MLEFPLVDHFVNMVRQESIGIVLVERFGALPPDLANSLRSVEDPDHLTRLLTWAVRCSDLDSFRARLTT